MYHWKAFCLISAMQNIPSKLIITLKNYINITSFKMKGSPDLGQAVIPSVAAVTQLTVLNGSLIDL